MFDSGNMAAGAVHNLLRPETVEALFVLWRTTHDDRYRRQGWAIFQAFEMHCRVRVSRCMRIEYDSMTAATLFCSRRATQGLKSPGLTSIAGCTHAGPAHAVTDMDSAVQTFHCYEL